jgi:oxalate decarboxylase
MAAPEPVRDGEGATDIGPRNLEVDRQNLDMLRPPATDRGTMPNLKFPFGMAHTRIQKGGWAREVTSRELPAATTIAGVNMRLNPGGVRELHWHKPAEWAFMLVGEARITAIDPNGHNFVDDVQEGDLWYFPGGIPHSIQGLAGGCEFLLAFDDGEFSENSTFSITDWFAHVPPAVLAKNFHAAEDSFARIPSEELYIFQAAVPPPLEEGLVEAPAGPARPSFRHRLMDQDPIETEWGRVRIADSTNFPVSKTIAAALVEVDPGAMRELHWHPTNDEWQYYIAGEARMGVFAAGQKARTYDFRAGDVGTVPYAMGHYIENTGSAPLRFLELFRSDHFADISLRQWIALSPPALVEAHLHLPEEILQSLPPRKQPVV